MPSNNDEQYRKVKNFLEEFLAKNSIDYMSLVYMEINISDDVQIIVRSTENYEKMSEDGFVELLKQNIYFVAGNRIDYAVTFNCDEQNIIFYYGDDKEIIFPVVDTELNSSMSVNEMDIEHMFYESNG